MDLLIGLILILSTGLLYSIVTDMIFKIRNRK